MLKTSTLRSGNPALNSKTFENFSSVSDVKMTLDGTINKTTISLGLLVLSAYYTFTNGILDYIIIGFVGGFILAIATIMKKEWSPFTVPVYAVLEGLALGGVSKIYSEAFFPGLIPQAITLTVAILLALLFAYKTKIINVTQNFKLGVFAATAGIAIVYIISFLMSLFGSGGLEFMNPSNSSIMSIGISLFVVIIASLNLVLDFDFIEKAVENGAPKYMEWYGAFGLLVTLIWLYLEILRLLAKLRNR